MLKPERIAPRARLAVAAALLFPLLAGCAGSRPPAGTLTARFDRLERDTRALAPTGPGQAVLDAARARRAEAERTKKAAAWNLALADAQAALALAQMEQAERRADRCRLSAEQAREGWDEALRLLIRTEQVARRTAADVPHEVASFEEPLADPPHGIVGEEGAPPATLEETERAFAAWRAAAGELRTPTGDLEERFATAAEAARRARNQAHAAHTHRAGRVAQELEARVRQAAAEEACARAAATGAELARARDAALRASLELERGLQDALRDQLVKAQDDAEQRQQQIYDALRQIEGKFASIRREARGTIVSLADILFDFNKATLKRDVEFALVRIATILNQFPEMRIRVEGHTDNVGRAEYNQELSQRRAQAVHDFLAEQGVAAERMTVEGFGMTRPIADNSTADGRQQNRRVDLVIEDEAGASATPAGGAVQPPDPR